jgi:hypothetical protein
MPSPPRALDDHDVAELHLGVLDPVQHLAERAVHRRDRLVGRHVRHLEDVVARRQEVVLRRSTGCLGRTDVKIEI